MLNFFKSDKENQNENKTVLFINKKQPLLGLKSSIEKAFASLDITIDKFTETFNSLIIDFDVKQEKNTIISSRFRFLEKEHIVYLFAESISVSQKDYQETITPAKINLKKHEVFKQVQDYILGQQDDGLYAFNNEENLPFIQGDDKTVKNYIFHKLQEDEYVLSILNIDSITFKKAVEIPKKAAWKFLLTTKRICLIAVAENDLSTFDISTETLELEYKTGKDIIAGASFSFLTELMNNTQYENIWPAVKQQNNRLDEFSNCLVKNHNHKSKHIDLISKCYALEYQNTNLDIHFIKSVVIKKIKALKVDKNQYENLTTTLKMLCTKYRAFGGYLVELVKDWNLGYKVIAAFSEILFEIQDPNIIKNGIDFQRYFRTLFLENKNEDATVFEFNLKYALALEWSNLYNEAIIVYKEIYNNLPDDSIVDLLPTNKTNILKGESGQQLKITILESILKCEEKALSNNALTTLRLAELQPLLEPRINELKRHNKYKEKALDIESVLNLMAIGYQGIVYDEKHYNRLDKTEVLEHVVPNCFKNATGFFDSLNGYIATINQPDYNAVISFLDKLDSNNYSEIYKIITNICYALKIDSPECYIGRADYSSSVIGIEGKPPYLIVGIDFIKTASPKQLNYNELTFLIAIELAHIYFEHSKITANDVWRGATEKGSSIVSVLVSLLPFAGSLGTILGNVTNVDKYTKIVNGVQKASNVAEKGKNILEIGEKLNINLLSNDKKESNSQDLLITSRLMEIIADKVALLFCGDLHDAIKSIIRSTSFFDKDLLSIDQYGLYTLLNRTNTADEFYYQETIIRIKSLCSFYLSDTYDDMRNILYKQSVF